MESIAYPDAPTPKRAHFARVPLAEVRIDQTEDGRWMWAVSYYSSTWGFGYAPLPKWGKFAPDRDSAISAGVEELLEALRAPSAPKVSPAVIDWLESLQQVPEQGQGDLFA